MQTNDITYYDDVSLKTLASVIRSHMNDERIVNAIKKPVRERQDAISHIVVDAIKNAPIYTLSGVPHVYCKSEGRYIPFGFHEMKCAIDNAMRRAHIPDGNYSRSGKTVSDAWSEVFCRKRQNNSSVVVMGNGVFDTMDMRLHPYSDLYLTSMSVPYNYNINEHPVMWKKFLGRVLPDPEMQDMLQEFVAATFIDRSVVKFEHMLMLLGSGSNGKSVVFEVIMGLLGEENVSTFSIKDLIGSGCGPQNIASCNGKRLNYCSEMRTVRIGEENADAFKSLVSGEPMMARALYHEPFKASAIPLIMSNANTLPRLDDATYSLQRRMLVLPFEQKIGADEQDKELATTLKTELSGIFNWVMEGLVRLRMNKYAITIPETVQKMVARYFRDNSSVSRWLDDRGFYATNTPTTGAISQWSKAQMLYNNFISWCDENGEQYMSNRKFADNMENLGFIRSRRAEGNGFSYYVVPSREDIVAANMDLAISMQSKVYLDKIKNEADENGRPKANGVDELEAYLGIPSGCVMNYLSSGQLEGSYIKMRDGSLVFDVARVQQMLAATNFYSMMAENEKGVLRSSAGRMRVMRRTFNTSMKTQGLPFRKSSQVSGQISRELSDCIIVPDEWEYSEESARAAIEAERARQQNKLNIQ